MGSLPALLPQWHPELDWVQVAVTSHCDAHCAYCPHTRLRSRWRSEHIDPEVFSHFITRLKNTQLVYLQGWGEPFVHPQFWELLAQVKKRGFLAGCTSNATMLTSDTLHRAVDSGLDILAFSLAGVGKHNDAIRRGTRYAQVMWAIEELQRLKARLGSSTPKIHLAYMVLRTHLQDLTEVPALVRDSGIDHAVLANLTLPLGPHWERQALLVDSETEYRELQSWLSDIFAAPQVRSKVYTHFYTPFMSPGSCSENVQRAMCLSQWGEISPCVLTQLPVQGSVPYWLHRQEHHLQRRYFGRLPEENLKQVWHKPDYKRFRKHLDWPECAQCAKRSIDTHQAGSL
ncbi:MAG: radical SAM/SPASM domain-containing protein [Thermodesulfobacteriota bacterium]